MVLEILTLVTLAIPTAPMTTAQVQPCVWPNICVKTVEAVVQVQPCVWPNICKQTPAPAPVTVAASEEKPFTICSLPNKCA